ncbi:unnamed protein product [Amoebophrya sp. A120]|nr:unnamed protein product [Amoebophrya sp. A120]|eukprot:GSA120T00021864001.1
MRVPPGTWALLGVHLLGQTALSQLERSLFVPFLRSLVVCDTTTTRNSESSLFSPTPVFDTGASSSKITTTASPPSLLQLPQEREAGMSPRGRAGDVSDELPQSSDAANEGTSGATSAALAKEEEEQTNGNNAVERKDAKMEIGQVALGGQDQEQHTGDVAKWFSSTQFLHPRDRTNEKEAHDRRKNDVKDIFFTTGAVKGIGPAQDGAPPKREDLLQSASSATSLQDEEKLFVVEGERGASSSSYLFSSTTAQSTTTGSKTSTSKASEVEPPAARNPTGAETATASAAPPNMQYQRASFYCDDHDQVVEQAQQRGGRLDCVRILAHAFSLPVFGCLGDMYGRKYITHYACLGLILYFFLLSIVAFGFQHDKAAGSLGRTSSALFPMPDPDVGSLAQQEGHRHSWTTSSPFSSGKIGSPEDSAAGGTTMLQQSNFVVPQQEVLVEQQKLEDIDAATVESHIIFPLPPFASRLLTGFFEHYVRPNLDSILVPVAVFFHGALAYNCLGFAIHNIMMDLSAHDVNLQVTMNTFFDITSMLCTTVAQFLVARFLSSRLEPRVNDTDQPQQEATSSADAVSSASPALSMHHAQEQSIGVLLPSDFGKVYVICFLIAFVVFLWQSKFLPETKPRKGSAAAAATTAHTTRNDVGNNMAAGGEMRSVVSSEYNLVDHDGRLTNVENDVPPHDSFSTTSAAHNAGISSSFHRYNLYKLPQLVTTSTMASCCRKRITARSGINAPWGESSPRRTAGASTETAAAAATSTASTSFSTTTTADGYSAELSPSPPRLSRGSSGSSPTSSCSRPGSPLSSTTAGANSATTQHHHPTTLGHGDNASFGLHKAVTTQRERNGNQDEQELLKRRRSSSYWDDVNEVDTILTAGGAASFGDVDMNGGRGSTKDSKIQQQTNLHSAFFGGAGPTSQMNKGGSIEKAVHHYLASLFDWHSWRSRLLFLHNLFRETFKVNLLLCRQSSFLRLWSVQILFYYLAESKWEVLASYTIAVWDWAPGALERLWAKLGWVHVCSLSLLPFVLRYVAVGRGGGERQTTSSASSYSGSNGSRSQNQEIGGTEFDFQQHLDQEGQLERFEQNRNDSTTHTLLHTATSSSARPLSAEAGAQDEGQDVYKKLGKLLIVASVFQTLCMGSYSLSAHIPVVGPKLYMVFSAFTCLMGWQSSMRFAFLTQAISCDPKLIHHRASSIAMIATVKNVAAALGAWYFSTVLFDAHVPHGSWESGLIFRVSFYFMVFADFFYIIAIVKHSNSSSSVEKRSGKNEATTPDELKTRDRGASNSGSTQHVVVQQQQHHAQKNPSKPSDIFFGLDEEERGRLLIL